MIRTCIRSLAARAAALALLCAGTAVPAAAQHYPGPGSPPENVMLVPGNYDGDIGAFVLNDPKLAPEQLPASDWFVLEKDANGMRLVRAEPGEGARPRFLDVLGEAQGLPEDATQRVWLHLPGVALKEGPIDEVRLRRRALVPHLGRAYALEMGDAEAARRFTLTAANGLRGRDGAHYAIEVDGERHEYLLPGFGWDHEIRFGGDIDRDGKPDFVVYVSAANSGAYYLLLSGQARAGMNVPAAYIWHGGC